MAGSLRGRAAVSYAAGESQREFDSLTCHKVLFVLASMAQHSNRPKPPSSSPTTPAMQPVKPRRNSGSMKAAKPDFGHEEEAPKSFCVVCNGEVVESHKMAESSTRHSMTKTGYNCSRCGIAYAFLPPKNVRRR
jgi:hypothetical protein